MANKLYGLNVKIGHETLYFKFVNYQKIMKILFLKYGLT